MSSEWFTTFVDGASHHTCNLASAAWVIYEPSGQLVTSGGAYLGPATNNMVEYSAIIELMWDDTLRIVSHLEVRLYSQLVFSHLNGDYQVRHPTYYVSF